MCIGDPGLFKHIRHRRVGTVDVQEGRTNQKGQSRRGQRIQLRVEDEGDKEKTGKK